MIERFQYENHLGEIITFGKDGIFANESDIRDYTWEANTINDVIVSMKRGITTKTLPVLVHCKSLEDANEIKDAIFEVIDKDASANQYGKFIIGDYYLKCFVTGSAKSKYTQSKGYLELSLEITTDKPAWIRENRKEFMYAESSSTEGLDYEFDYEFDFGLRDNNTSYIANTHFSACDFIIKISGYAADPSISIGGHTYRVSDVVVGNNELLTIDSRKREVTLTRKNGVKENKFAFRDKNSYIFEKIKAGSQGINWNGKFNWELTIIEERSEPKWT